MKSRKPVKRSRKCPRGIRKSDGKCKRKPGPKRSRKMKRSRRRTSKKLAKTVRRSRKCVRGKRKSDGKCKRKPGPKRSRKMKRSKRTTKHKFRIYNDITVNIYKGFGRSLVEIAVKTAKSNTLLRKILSSIKIPQGYSIFIGKEVIKEFDIPIGSLTRNSKLKVIMKKVVQLSPETIPVEIVLNDKSYSLSKKSDETINDILTNFINGFDPKLYHIFIKNKQVDINKNLGDFFVRVEPVKIVVQGVLQGAGGGGKVVSSGKLPQTDDDTLKITYWEPSKYMYNKEFSIKDISSMTVGNKDITLKKIIEHLIPYRIIDLECKCKKTGDEININQTLKTIVKQCPDIIVTAASPKPASQYKASVVPKPAPQYKASVVPKPAITKMDSATRKELREGLERIQGKENITEKERCQGGEINGFPYWGIKKKKGTRLENENVIEVTGYVPRGKKKGSDLVTREHMSQGEIIKVRSVGVSEGGVQKCGRNKTKESCDSKFEGCIWDSAKNICGVDELYGSDHERDGIYLDDRRGSDSSFVLVIPSIIYSIIEPGFYKSTQKFFEENNIYFLQDGIAMKYSKKLLFAYVNFLHNDVLQSKLISPSSIMNTIRTSKLQLIQPRHNEDVSQDIRNEVIGYMKKYEYNIDNISRLLRHNEDVSQDILNEVMKEYEDNIVHIIRLLKENWPKLFGEGDDDVIRRELEEFAKKSKDMSDLDAFIVTYKFCVYPRELVNDIFQMDFRSSSIPNNCLIEEVNKKRINSSSYIMYHGTSLEVWRKIRESLLNLRDADDPDWRWNFGDYIPPNCTELGKPPTNKPCQLFGSGLILKAPLKKGNEHLGGDPLPVTHGGLFGVGLYVTRSLNKAIAYARQAHGLRYNQGVVLRLEIAPGDLHRPTKVDQCQKWIAENRTLSSSYVHSRMCIGFQQGKENYEEFTIPYFEGWRVLRIMGLVGIDEHNQRKADLSVNKHQIDEVRYPPPLAVVRQESINKLKSPPK